MEVDLTLASKAAKRRARRKRLADNYQHETHDTLPRNPMKIDLLNETIYKYTSDEAFTAHIKSNHINRLITTALKCDASNGVYMLLLCRWFGRIGRSQSDLKKDVFQRFSPYLKVDSAFFERLWKFLFERLIDGESNKPPIEDMIAFLKIDQNTTQNLIEKLQSINTSNHQHLYIGDDNSPDDTNHTPQVASADLSTIEHTTNNTRPMEDPESTEDYSSDRTSNSELPSNSSAANT